MPLTAVILSNFLFSDIVFFFTVFTGICSGSYFSVVTLHIIQDNVLEFFHDALAAQGDHFFAIDKHRRGRRFAGAGQADADVGMLRFTGAVDDAAHHGHVHRFHARIGFFPFRHLLAQIGLDVVRPQPGQAITIGANLRSPMVCKISWPTITSRVRSPPGSGVSEIRMVSPMPSCSNTDKAAVEATMPLLPMPASVRPRCKG